MIGNYDSFCLSPIRKSHLPNSVASVIAASFPDGIMSAHMQSYMLSLV